MERFDSEKGLIHLVFANHEDTYYLDSLVKLNLWQYLYSQLRQQGYKGIYFIRGDADNCSLTISDQDSFSIYDKYETQSFWGKFFNKEKTYNANTVIQIGSIDGFFDRMMQMMRKERRLAFVFSIEAFSELRDDPDTVRSLCSACTKNYDRNHLLLIQSPVIAGASRHYMSAPHSIFMTDVFPEILHIFSRTQNVPVYENLKQEMGERVSFLNTLERQEIYYMVLHLLLKGEAQTRELLPEARDFADFIWFWYHSDEFRQNMGPVLPENEKRQKIVIEKALSDGRKTWQSLQRKIDALRQGQRPDQPLYRLITGLYDEDMWLRLIYEDNTLLRKISRMHFKISEEKKAAGDNTWYYLRRIKEELGKPRLCEPEDKEIDFMNKCVAAMEKADQRNDYDTFSRAASALNSIVTDTMLAEDSPEDAEKETRIRHIYISVIQVSEQLFDESKSCKELGDKISHEQEKMMAEIREIREYDLSHGYTRGESDAWISPRKAAVAEMNKNINNMKHIHTDRYRRLNSYKESISNLENVIMSTSLGVVEDIKNATDEAKQLLQDISEENRQFYKHVSDGTHAIDDLISGGTLAYSDIHMSKDEIDKAFDDILKKEGLFDEFYKNEMIN